MKKLKFILLLLFFTASVMAQKKADGVLNRYDFGDEKSVKLSRRLKEISGLTTTPDGRLFCHNDEKGFVFELDKNTGKVIKEFYLGSWVVEADFEAIAFAKGRFYLVTSSGYIYEFKEGQNKAPVGYNVYTSGATSRFNVEGACYDPVTNSLLLACKDYPGKNYSGYRAVYAFSLADYSINEIPRLLIPLSKIDGRYNLDDFHPSGIAYCKRSDTFFILSAKGEKAIMEMDRFGNVLNVEKLKDKDHRQPEGIVVMPDNDLIIADEADGEEATLTTYKLR